MLKKFLSLPLVLFYIFGFSQSAVVHQINEIVKPPAAFEPFKYLASDQLKGRSTRRPEIDVAANYIADFFRKNGIKALKEAPGYFQAFELKGVTPPAKGSLRVNDSIYSVGKNLLQLAGADVSINAPIIYVGYANDLSAYNVAGKIVLTDLGDSDSSTFQQGRSTMRSKLALLRQKGAVAVIERFWQKDVEWSMLQNYFGRERFSQDEHAVPEFLLQADKSFATGLSGAVASLTSEGNKSTLLPAKNVIGWVQGTDAKLREQYVVLSAHYDHIGVAPKPVEAGGKMDSIFNGARDNAIGVTAVMNAAKYFAKHPAKRSMLFILFTGEEMGLLGSHYFSENPVMPFNKLVYNLNCDNGGYNDTGIVTVIGLGRTSADDDIKNAATAYGVQAIADPMPELNLFDRSDNLNFAVNGVPSPTYGMGVRSFDSVVRKYYHQLADEVSSFDLDYGLKYIRSYVLAAKNIADNPTQPTWAAGDKYEAAWKSTFSSAGTAYPPAKSQPSQKQSR